MDLLQGGEDEDSGGRTSLIRKKKTNRSIKLPVDCEK